MRESFVRLAANQGAGSSSRRSYDCLTTSKSGAEVRNMVMIFYISAPLTDGGRSDAVDNGEGWNRVRLGIDSGDMGIAR